MTRHRRFLAAFATGLLVLLASRLWQMDEGLRILAGTTVFFSVYIALMWRFAGDLTPDHLRASAAASDEGVAFILMLAVGSVAISLTFIFLVLNGPQGGSRVEWVLGLASVPLGWLMLHALVAFHYAHLFYRRDADGKGGLAFPGVTEPGAWDFLYFSFGIGMTAQVSDVIASSAEMRKVILFHAIGAFFYNTVILALAVNVALAARG